MYLPHRLTLHVVFCIYVSCRLVYLFIHELKNILAICTFPRMHTVIQGNMSYDIDRCLIVMHTTHHVYVNIARVKQLLLTNASHREYLHKKKT